MKNSLWFPSADHWKKMEIDFIRTPDNEVGIHFVEMFALGDGAPNREQVMIIREWNTFILCTVVCCYTPKLCFYWRLKMTDRYVQYIIFFTFLITLHFTWNHLKKHFRRKYFNTFYKLSTIAQTTVFANSSRK